MDGTCICSFPMTIAVGLDQSMSYIDAYKAHAMKKKTANWASRWRFADHEIEKLSSFMRFWRKVAIFKKKYQEMQLIWLNKTVLQAWNEKTKV